MHDSRKCSRQNRPQVPKSSNSRFGGAFLELFCWEMMFLGKHPELCSPSPSDEGYGAALRSTYNIKNTYHVIPEGIMIKLDLRFALINQ